MLHSHARRTASLSIVIRYRWQKVVGCDICLLMRELVYLVAGGEDKLCAKGFQKDAPLCAHGVWHRQNELVAFR